MLLWMVWPLHHKPLFCCLELPEPSSPGVWAQLGDALLCSAGDPVGHHQKFPTCAKLWMVFSLFHKPLFCYLELPEPSSPGAQAQLGPLLSAGDLAEICASVCRFCQEKRLPLVVVVQRKCRLQIVYCLPLPHGLHRQ